METVKYQNAPQEEIFAEHDSKKNTENNVQSPDKDIESLIQTSCSIELDKHQLFFHSQPNIMAYDTVTIKNTGKTCIYFQWQKNSSSFQLEEKKNDGFDRFFCHYGEDKIYPDDSYYNSLINNYERDKYFPICLRDEHLKSTYFFFLNILQYLKC